VTSVFIDGNGGTRLQPEKGNRAHTNGSENDTH
jgi:hypothetical protein